VARRYLNTIASTSAQRAKFKKLSVTLSPRQTKKIKPPYPYWNKESKPNWDRSKVNIETKSTTDSRMNVFSTHTAKEFDNPIKVSACNNATPKIKLFDIKFLFFNGHEWRL